nr:cysteine-rich CWC family protein [Chromobacterium sp. ASV5]
MNRSEEAASSPCIGQCRLDASGQTCLGCRRTLDEIAGWSGFRAEEKRAVWDRLLNLPLQVQAKTCPSCGAAFVCGEGGAAGACWCADLPPLLPVVGATGDCLCPACLQAAARGGSHEKTAGRPAE